MKSEKINVKFYKNCDYKGKIPEIHHSSSFIIFTFSINLKIRNFTGRSRAVTVKKSSKESDALSKLLFF